MHMAHWLTRTRGGLLALLAALLGLLAVQAGVSGRAQAAPLPPTVSVYTAGNSLNFTATSPDKTPVAWQIQLGSIAPAGSPPTFGKFLSASASSNGVRATSFTHRFARLSSGFTYHFIVKATDAGGQSSYKTGQIQTLGRDVSMTFHQVTVINDGDPEWYRGDGEIRFDFAVNGCWQPRMATGWRSLGDGDSFYAQASFNPGIEGSKVWYYNAAILASTSAIFTDRRQHDR
jgi:hypothetical protein